MGETNIGWTDFSANPIRARLAGMTTTKGGYASGVGHYCEKVSDGCRNCYSSTLQPRFGLPEFQAQRNGKVEVFFDPSKLGEVLRIKKPKRVFWCDMTDMFGSWVPFEWIAACFGVMAATPHLVHQVLTKRPDRALEFFAWVEKRAADGARMFPDDVREWRIHQLLNVSARKAGADVGSHHGGAWPLSSVHLGVSCEDQESADKRIPILLKCPAAVLWVSAEPLLGPVRVDDLRDGAGGVLKPLVGLHWAPGTTRAGTPGMILQGGKGPAVSWVVVGGESGADRRACDPAWIDSIVAQCADASVPVFVKQDAAAKPGKQGRLSDATWARKEFPEVRCG